MWILDKITSDLGKTKTWIEIDKVSLNYGIWKNKIKNQALTHWMLT